MLDLLAVGVSHDSPGLGQVILDQSLAAASISGCYGDGAAYAVGPVDVAMDPVNGDALRSLDVTADHNVVVGGVCSRLHVGAGLWEKGGKRERKDSYRWKGEEGEEERKQSLRRRKQDLESS